MVQPRYPARVHERFLSKTRPAPGPLSTPCLVWTSQVKARSPRKPGRGRWAAGGASLEHGQFWLEGRCRQAHRVALALALRKEPGNMWAYAHGWVASVEQEVSS